MAISMGAALLGSAIIGGGASILGSNANSKAINSASNAQNQATQQNLALQRDIYNQNANRLSPYDQRGNAAGNAINALLGLSGTSSAPASGAQPGAIDWAAYVQGNPDAAANWQVVQGTQNDTFGGDVSRFGAYHYNADGARRDLTPFTAQPQTAASTTDAQGAFNNYLNSTGYQFQLGEMNKGANAQFRAAGALDSGAAVKAAQDRAQNMGTSYFNNYLALLGNQQGVGLSAASAAAGVGQNYANAASNINQNNANALGNLALAKGQNTNALLGNLSSSFGLGMGALNKWAA